MQDKIFYSICFGFLAGALLRSFYFINLYVASLVLLISLAVILFFSVSGNNGRWLTVSVLALAFSLGVIRFQVSDITPPQVLEAQVGKKITMSGIIVEEPVTTDTTQRFPVEVSSKGGKIRILVSVGYEAEYAYGDEVRLAGKLQKPENFITDQSKEFDYVNYLRKDGILYVMRYPDAEMVSGGHGNPLKEGLHAAKKKFLGILDMAIAPPESLLMGGLILGERAAFDDDMRQDFIDTGTIHIVALSGYNVTIIAEGIMRLLSFMPRVFAFGSGMVAIFLFVLMTGASSTAVRAGIMAILVLVARATGREYDMVRALVFAILVMVLLNPFILAFDVSFQLSVLATVAVIFLSPRTEKYFDWVTNRFGLRDIMSVTTAVYLFVFPFILYKMGSLSLVALPANFLVLPFIPATMALGFMAGGFGLVWQGLAAPLGFLAYLLLHWELGVIGFMARVPFASLTVPYFPPVLALGVYAWFIYFFFGSKIKMLRPMT